MWICILETSWFNNIMFVVCVEKQLKSLYVCVCFTSFEF
jgi:hypothetical protein